MAVVTDGKGAELLPKWHVGERAGAPASGADTLGSAAAAAGEAEAPHRHEHLGQTSSADVWHGRAAPPSADLQRSHGGPPDYCLQTHRARRPPPPQAERGHHTAMSSSSGPLARPWRTSGLLLPVKRTCSCRAIPSLLPNKHHQLSSLFHTRTPPCLVAFSLLQSG